jgi:hypothetical protein
MQRVSRRIGLTDFMEQPRGLGKVPLHGRAITHVSIHHLTELIRKEPGDTGVELCGPDPGPARHVLIEG